MEEIKKLNLFERLLKISEEVGVVAKNLVVKIGSGGYKAVGEFDVISTVKPLEVKYRVFSYPTIHEVIQSKELIREVKRDGGIVTVVDQFVRVRSVYRFVNIDNPYEFIEVEAIGDGVDAGDKASGKAQTYADKYALLKGYKIPTGDDPDQEASKDYNKSLNETAQAPTKKVEDVDRKDLEAKFDSLASKEEKEKAAAFYNGEVPKVIPTAALAKLVEKLSK